MIARLVGVLAEKSPPWVLLDVNGVGYEVQVSMHTFYQLPQLGARVSLLTQFVVREDAQQLYGFLDVQERACFRELTKISGVGARIALSVLSGLSPDELARAVAQQETARLIKVPGVGKKTAERLLLELRGKLDSAKLGLSEPLEAANDAHSDILQALLALGYSDKEAQGAVRKLEAQVGVSEGIKQAIKGLSA